MPSQILMSSNGGGFTAITNPAASFFSVSGFSGANEAQIQVEIPLAGTISSLYVRVLANDSAVDQTVTLRIGGVGSALTATITAGQTGTFTGSASVAVSVGDIVSLQVTSGAGAGSVTYSIFSVIYTSNTPNTAIQAVAGRSGGGTLVSSGSSVFTGLTGVSWVSPQAAPTSAAWILRTAADFSYLRTYLTINTNTSAGATCALYVDGADTALSAAIAALTSGEALNTATTVSVAAGSSVTFRYSNPNTGNGASSYQYTLTQVTRTGTSANSAWSNIGVLGITGAGLAITSQTNNLFFPLGGGGTTAQTTGGNVQVLARQRFKVQNMQANVPTNGAGITFNLRVSAQNAISLVLSSGQVGIFLDSTAAQTVNSTDTLNWRMVCTTAGVTGGWTVAGLTVEMMSIDSIPQRTLVGVGI